MFNQLGGLQGLSQQSQQISGSPWQDLGPGLISQARAMEMQRLIEMDMCRINRGISNGIEAPSRKPLTIREELQFEINDWLKDTV